MNSTMNHRKDALHITGASENNLKNISLSIPKNKLIVFTGVSGSGKSSLVFDTIAVESQRQLNETFSWFVRNRLPKHEKPNVETIDNLSTAIIIDQKPVGGNARSTVGTMTDIYPLMRLLFSRIGEPSAGASTAYSFNDPAGMCKACDGLGHALQVDLDRLLDKSKSLQDGAIQFPMFAQGTWQWQIYAHSGYFDAEKPLSAYNEEEWEKLLYGKGSKVPIKSSGGVAKVSYEGLLLRFNRLYLKRDISSLASKHREAIMKVVSEEVCPVCHGARLNATALQSIVKGYNIAQCSMMEIADLVEVLKDVHDPIGGPIVNKLLPPLERICKMGLGYLSLHRETSTLSGGEAQRLKMVRHLSSSLTGMTYIFDEPSVGLHPHDVARLIALMQELRDKGNTVLVVEHDRDVIEIADHVIDMGPLAGQSGGEIVFEGTVEGLVKAQTLTGRHLRERVAIKEAVRDAQGWIEIQHASKHNLNDVQVDIPIGVLTAVTGVAGSGKSTLVGDVLAAQHPEVLIIDQSAIGTSSRSCPATYLGVMDEIRKRFAEANGVAASLFSFNAKGACPVCEGRGVMTTDMAFMDPVTTICEHCEGRRYKEEVLQYRLRGQTIVDVLAMTAEQAAAFFDEDKIHQKLKNLIDVGLGYISLGQTVSSMSGGERQRLKLATELHLTGSIFVMDEPTTGLHMADIEFLMKLLNRIVDNGNTLIVIEHNLDVIKQCDWIMDMGPGGGKHGGHIIFEGTPKELLMHPVSLTAACLRKELR